jgi:hypothetical protein
MLFVGVLHVNALFCISFAYTVTHLKERGSVMATSNVNAKSQKMQARVPHDVVKEVEETMLEGETTGQYIVSALRGEAKRRRRKAKAETPAE